MDLKLLRLKSINSINGDYFVVYKKSEFSFNVYDI